MATLEQQSSPLPDLAAKEDSSEPQPVEDAADVFIPEAVITKQEIAHFQELGLGRGVDSTVPHMWKHKSPFQIRRISENLENVIGTNENGIKHGYRKVVSSLQTQQSKIQLALNVPTSQVNIGLDAHYSQSTNSTVTIAGDKVRTRTISFRHGFEDLSVPGSKIDDAQFSLDKTQGLQVFENDLATWLLANLDQSQKRRNVPKTEPKIGELEGQTAVEKLQSYVQRIPSIESAQAKALEIACQIFVFELGITHFVSSIDLGALKYTFESSSSTASSIGGGGKLGADSAASVNGETDYSSEVTFQTSEHQRVGFFDEKTGLVRRNTSDEAVIGFQIQPISKLISLEFVQLLMNVALDVYIKSKTDNTLGPYLVSTTINKKLVYWKVDQADGSIRGTEELKEASLLYLTPAGSKFYPSDFAILYWGEKLADRKILTDVTNPFSEVRNEIPKLPRAVTRATSTLFGSSNGPLLLKDTFGYKDAQFSLYSRVKNSVLCWTCVSTPVGIHAWIEGDEFYIKHPGHSLVSTYVAMQQDRSQQNTYTTTTLSRIKDPQPGECSELGMLFRLHPWQLRYPDYKGEKPSAVLPDNVRLNLLPNLAPESVSSHDTL